MTTEFNTTPQDISGVWYPDCDHLIPYLVTYRAKHSQPLNRADLARWMKSPEVRAW
ncbi:hypothetical protein GCM10011374_03190 [Kocuria dechangensis]|uniref:Uncharacterized protein n=1 Tax=Kocuria dechangensis TaxID=1176249 RepID=A0A917GGD2_9MICC|nr:hypothetical protein GCM10011374_03190 [Kocuria dechangensis]